MPRVKTTPPKTGKAAANRPLPVWRQQLNDWAHHQVQVWKRPLIGVAMALPILGALAGGGYWAVSSGWLARSQNALVHRVLGFSAGIGLRVNDVRVVGRAEVSKQTILAILNVRQGDPILGFDPDAAREQLERLSWVEAVTVRRELPDLIQIRLVERQPAALWQNQGKLSLIDADGNELRTDRIRDYRQLPLLVGMGAANRVHDLFALLASSPSVAEHLVAANWIADRRWDLTLDNEIVLRLPESDPAAALVRLEKVQQEHDLLDQPVVSIDLRFDNRLIVETPSPEVAEAIDPQKGI